MPREPANRGAACAARRATRSLRPALDRFADFALQLLDLVFEYFVFGHLALEKLIGDGGFAIDATRSKQISVNQFFAAIVKIAHLHEALVDERLHAVVDLAEAGAQFAREIALAQVGPGFDQSEQSEMTIFQGAISRGRNDCALPSFGGWKQRSFFACSTLFNL